ncbi:hypothetical protein [Pseudoduganella violaceinigra]|uniref:hypothetical protein n=1 Tax=Pseudoduganella violaceinigra TaxID=246602 RepID=UPI0004095CD6|nr:hypothetical protein [Pseudoduganella violaceinigra]
MHCSQFVQRTCAIIALAIGLAGSAAAERGPATPEERARVVQLAAAANQDPVGVMTSADGRWFMKWSDEVPDYMFGPDKGAFWMDGGAAKGDLRRVLRFHHMLSTAAYQVQHQILDPEKDAATLEAKTIAGVDGLLHAYESLKDKRAENRSEALDQAIAMRDQGKLAAFVQSLPPAPKR